MSLYECDRPGCTWKNHAWRYGFADAGMSHAMHMDDHERDEPDDDRCPDCLPGSECGACADDRRYHEDRDNRLEQA